MSYTANNIMKPIFLKKNTHLLNLALFVFKTGTNQTLRSSSCKETAIFQI